MDRTKGTKSPRLNPEAKLALLHCYSRPDPIMLNYASRSRLLRFSFTSKSASRSTNFLLRGCWIRDCGEDFSITLNRGSGPSIRLSARTFFAIMSLSRPQRFRLCAPTFSDADEMSANGFLSNWLSALKRALMGAVRSEWDDVGERFDRLIELSSGATELVVGSCSERFLPLIKRVASNLRYLECDPRLFEKAAFDEPLALDCFTVNTSGEKVYLDSLLRHQIRHLDLRAKDIGAYALGSQLSAQPALEQLSLRADLSALQSCLDFYTRLQQVAPKLLTLRLRLGCDIELSSKCQRISEEIVDVFERIQSFGSECRSGERIRQLDIDFVAYLSVVENCRYETNWRRHLRDNPAFKVSDAEQMVKSAEYVEIRTRDDFLSLRFRAELRKSHNYEQMD